MNPRVRETGLGASHRFIVSTTVQLRSSKLVAAHRGAEASRPTKGVGPSSRPSREWEGGRKIHRAERVEQCRPPAAVASGGRAAACAQLGVISAPQGAAQTSCPRKPTRGRSCSEVKAELVRSSFCLAKRLQVFIVQPDKSPSLTWWQRQDAAEAVSNTGRIKGV